MFLNSFNYFRAIAIVLIVAGHSYVDIPFNTVFNNFLQNLITGGTTLFVFISGFLFHHIFYKKFNYQNFIIQKIRNVYIPYFILGFIPLASVSDFSNISQMIKLHLNGTFFTAYWYIPFILLVFLLSPLFIKFIKLDAKIQLSILIIGVILALFIQRPINNENVFHSVLYFFPIYILGIICSINKEIIYIKLRNKEFYILFLVLFLALFQSIFIGGGNFHKNFFEYNGIDLMYLQKILLSIFLMVFLNRFENYQNKYMELVANSSFAIFFIHPYVLNLFGKIRGYFDIHHIYPWIIYPFYVIFVLLISILIAVIFKRIFNKNSRYICGY